MQSLQQPDSVASQQYGHYGYGHGAIQQQQHNHHQQFQQQLSAAGGAGHALSGSGGSGSFAGHMHRVASVKPSLESVPEGAPSPGGPLPQLPNPASAAPPSMRPLLQQQMGPTAPPPPAGGSMPNGFLARSPSENDDLGAGGNSRQGQAQQQQPGMRPVASTGSLAALMDNTLQIKQEQKDGPYVPPLELPPMSALAPPLGSGSPHHPMMGGQLGGHLGAPAYTMQGHGHMQAPGPAGLMPPYHGAPAMYLGGHPQQSMGHVKQQQVCACAGQARAMTHMAAGCHLMNLVATSLLCVWAGAGAGLLARAPRLRPLLLQAPTASGPLPAPYVWAGPSACC